MLTITVGVQQAAAAITRLEFLSIYYMAGPMLGAGDSENHNTNLVLKEILAFL